MTISVPLEPTTYDLKTWPSAFAAVRAGLKAWELRLDDRGYEVGDNLILREWDNHAETYTGEIERRTVTWLLRGPAFGLPQGYVIMSLAAAPSPAGRGVEAVAAAIDALREPGNKTSALLYNGGLRDAKEATLAILASLSHPVSGGGDQAPMAPGEFGDGPDVQAMLAQQDGLGSPA